MKRWPRAAIIGTALFASWPFAAFYSETLLSLGVLELSMRNAIWLCSLTFLIIGLFFLSLYGYRADHAFFKRKYQIGFASGFALGNACILLAGLIGGNHPTLMVGVACLGAALAGFTSAFFEIGWRCILYVSDPEDIEINLAITGILSRIMIVLFMSFRFRSASLILLLIVVASPLLMMTCKKKVRDMYIGFSAHVADRPCFNKKSIAKIRSITWSGLLLIVFWFGYCTLENMTVPQRMADSPILLMSAMIGVAVSFILAGLFFRYSRSVSFLTVLKWGSVALVASFFIAAIMPSEYSFVTYFLGSSVQLVMGILLWISGISYIQTHSESFARTQALIRLFLYIGVISASLAWNFLERIELVSVLFGLSLILLTVLIFALSKETTELMQKNMLSGSAVQNKDLELGATEGDARSLKVEQLADSYSLSAREKEVYGLLINGRDSVYIRNQLHISKNTVSSHIKSIYRKMGVHSRQELIDVFEEGSSPESTSPLSGSKMSD